jgi:hypothetical protein
MLIGGAAAMLWAGIGTLKEVVSALRRSRPTDWHGRKQVSSLMYKIAHAQRRAQGDALAAFQAWIVDESFARETR